MDLDTVLSILYRRDREEHESTIPPLDINDPMFHWIFRNIDFQTWSRSDSKVLWLSGPPECDIHRASSYIVDHEKNRDSETPRFVLYFFCSAVTEKKPIATVFIHTLFRQIICDLSVEKGMLIVKVFLTNILEQILEEYKSLKVLKEEELESSRLHQFKEAAPKTIIKNILEAPVRELWMALEVVLGHEQQRDLLLIVDGLEKVEHRNFELIKGILAFIGLLHKRNLKVKLLLTSRPQAGIREILDGIPCIEYDQERKGAVTIHILFYLGSHMLRVPSFSSI